MFKKIFLASFLLLILNSYSYASDGNFLLSACQEFVKYSHDESAEFDARKSTYCLGMLKGMAMGMFLYKDFVTETPLCVNMPSNVSTEQMVRIVMKFLQDNPAKLNQEDGLLVALAYIGAFPCD